INNLKLLPNLEKITLANNNNLNLSENFVDEMMNNRSSDIFLNIELIESNNITNEQIINFNSYAQSKGYNNFQIRRSLIENDIEIIPLNKMLSKIYPNDSKNVSSIIEIINKEKLEYLRSFLENCARTSDYIEQNKDNHEEGEEELEEDKCSSESKTDNPSPYLQFLKEIINKLLESKENRIICNNIAEDADSTCGDKIAYTLMLFQNTLELPNEQEVNNFSLDQLIDTSKLFSRREFVTNKAKEIINLKEKNITEREDIEEVEIYLGLNKKLNDDLDLKYDIKSMLYEDCCDIKDEELSDIKKQFNDRDDLFEAIKYILNSPILKNNTYFKDISDKIDKSIENDANNAAKRGEEEAKILNIYKSRDSKIKNEIKSNLNNIIGKRAHQEEGKDQIYSDLGSTKRQRVEPNSSEVSNININKEQNNNSKDR
ncbi:NEL domain-containing protein, partial [Flavobacteriaceae bacterium]|nr:NEL domain-containing protein [Flavobacteriaceae bacterium]